MAKILQCIKEVLNKQKLKTIGSIDWGSVKRYREKPKKSLIEVEGIKKVLNTQNRLTLRLASHHYVLCFNPIKGTLNTCI